MHAAAGNSPTFAHNWSFDASPGTPPSEQTRSHERRRSAVGSQVAEAPASTSPMSSSPPVPQAAIVVANTIATRIVRMGEHDAHDPCAAQDHTAGVIHV